MTQDLSYKDSLNLPKTDFPMKASLSEREPGMLATWEKQGLYQAIRNAVKGKKKYILHDGPPYANGNTHIGHALNKILKDMIVRYQTMRGHDSLYVPGWDCHGLPIEHACLKEMGKRKDEVERVAFRKEARKYAERFVAIQREEFKRLGIFGEWGNPYLTMNFDYQAAIAESFLKIFEKGFIEQRLKPVPWCWECETALADAELEYENKQDDTVYVKFRMTKDSLGKLASKLPEFRLDGKALNFLVWTTTPWTLPANVGIALNPDLDYMGVEINGEFLFFAEKLYDQLLGKVISEPTLAKSAKSTEVFHNIKGVIFEGLEYEHPFLPRVGKVIQADYVSAEEGTGIVHIAPGHGEEDYQYGHLANKLPIFSPVNEKGKFESSSFYASPEKKDMGVKGSISFVESYPEFINMHVFKANMKLIELLKGQNAWLHTEKYVHSYPHCWRCKKPIIFRATPQWFMKIDHQNLRAKMKEAIENKIKFTPDGGKNRIGGMVETRPDWCLSRQRYWGVPIPIISCDSCGKNFVSETKGAIVRAFREKGADVWFEKEPIDFLGGKKPVCCANQNLKKETDIIDVWFDSGVSHQAVLKPNRDLAYPADLYLEGSDQHRGWFQSSLTAGMALDEFAPFKGVLTHGFVVDGEGKKMSKSAGNVVAPQDVMKEFGADILRLWVASCDYQFDVRLSKEILRQLADSYRKIRNTFRYILGNLYDFDPSKNAFSLNKMHFLDQWAVQKTDQYLEKILNGYEKFDFHNIYRSLNEFCGGDLSSYYFDVLKDTLYTAGKNSFLRRSAQTALAMILDKLTRVIAPILPFTADEVWQFYQNPSKTSSVHLALMPDPQKEKQIFPQFSDWEFIRALRDAVTPFLEKKREEKLIGSSLDAKIFLEIKNPVFAALAKKYAEELPRIFIVSQVYLLTPKSVKMEPSEWTYAGSAEKIMMAVAVDKADGHKCGRCWNYSEAVGSDAEHAKLCRKCITAIRGANT